MQRSESFRQQSSNPLGSDALLWCVPCDQPSRPEYPADPNGTHLNGFAYLGVAAGMRRCALENESPPPLRCGLFHARPQLMLVRSWACALCARAFLRAWAHALRGCREPRRLRTGVPQMPEVGLKQPTLAHTHTPTQVGHSIRPPARSPARPLAHSLTGSRTHTHTLTHTHAHTHARTRAGALFVLHGDRLAAERAAVELLRRVPRRRLDAAGARATVRRPHAIPCASHSFSIPIPAPLGPRHRLRLFRMDSRGNHLHTAP